jgi:hypothetical protein
MADDTETTLPFGPAVGSVADWLAGLPTNNERERHTLLFSGLQALNQAGVEPAFHFQALEKIRSAAFQATCYLTSVFLGKPLPLDPGVRKLAKLSVQFQAELAQGYCALVQAKGFSKIFSAEEQGRIVHCALRSYNQMFLRLALMYEAAPSSVWLRVNEIYRMAERANLSRWVGPCRDLAHSAACGVEELYLRMLVFRLLSPYRLGQEEIQRVFDAVQQHGHLLSLGGSLLEEGRKADFAVDLDTGAMPAGLAREEGGVKGGDVRYLFVRNFRRALGALGSPQSSKESGFTAQLSQNLQIRLGGSLVPMADKRSVTSRVVVGYKNLVEAMGRPEDQAEFNLLDLEEHILPFSKLDSSKTSGTFRAAAPVAVQPALPILGGGLVKPSDGILCRISPADAPGFYLVEGKDLTPTPDCLVGVLVDDKLNQFGRVCPGRDQAATPGVFGFELLASRMSLVKAYFDASPKKRHRCFLSGTGAGRFHLITPPMRLRGGDALSVGSHDKGDRYKVVKMLEKTAEFCLFEVVREPASA